MGTGKFRGCETQKISKNFFQVGFYLYDSMSPRPPMLNLRICLIASHPKWTTKKISFLSSIGDENFARLIHPRLCEQFSITFKIELKEFLKSLVAGV